jgi:methyl-accepting chemotaxis protein
MDDISFRKKFGLVFIVILIGLLAIGGLYVNVQTREITRLETELGGLPPWQPALGTIRFMQQSRGLSTKWINGDNAAREPVLARMNEADAALRTLEASLAGKVQHQAELAELKAAWDEVKRIAQAGPEPGLPKKHTQAINIALRLLNHVAFHAGLLQDTAHDVSLMTVLLYDRIPYVVELYGQFRAAGSGILQSGQSTPAQKIQVHVLLNDIGRTLAHLDEELKYLVEQGQSLSDVVRDYRERVVQRRAMIFEIAEKQLLSGTPTLSSQQFFDEMTAAIDAAYTFNEKNLLPVYEARLHEELAAAKQARLVAVGIVLAILATVGLLFLVMAKGILQRVEALSHGARGLAGGDLSASMTVTGKDELSQAIRAIDQARIALAGLIGHIGQAVRDVDAQNHTLIAASEQVASAAESQSATVSAIAATIEEMSSAIASLADSSTTARELSTQSERLSTQGGDAVARTIADISSIATRVQDSASIIQRLGAESEKVTAVVGTIKEIADQTNLLALNAAIEAARAGESGRGFAVVADEVRKLAERTSKATEEIHSTITHIQAQVSAAVEAMAKSVGQVQTGVQTAEASGETMREIYAQSVNLMTTIGDISRALTEQSAATHDIARNVESLAQLSEETHAAADASHDSVVSMQGSMRRVGEQMASFRT